MVFILDISMDNEHVYECLLEQLWSALTYISVPEEYIYIYIFCRLMDFFLGFSLERERASSRRCSRLGINFILGIEVPLKLRNSSNMVVPKRTFRTNQGIKRF